MYRIFVTACVVAAMVVTSSCAGGVSRNPEPAGLVPVWHAAAEVEAATNQRLAAADAVRQKLLTVQGTRNPDNTFVPFNNLLIELDNVSALYELTANVHPDAAVRQAAEKGQQRVGMYLNDLRLDPTLYRAISNVAAEGLDNQAQRFQSHLLRDYRRAGVDKDDATRQKLAELNDRIITTGQEFDRNLREDMRFIKVTREDLAGLPDDYIAAHPPGPDGMITITTELADYNPFQTYAQREDLRRELYVKFLQRGYPANDKTLMELLELRHQYATLLGYPDWAAYNAEDKMVKTEAVITDFIDKVAGMAKPGAKDDIATLLARKKQDSPNADVIHEWDSAYYQQKVRAEQFGVDAKEIRSYFEFGRVKEGILSLAQDFFGVTFKLAPSADVWDKSVQAYDVYDGERYIGRFYLDLHPRENKYSHFAAFPMLTGVPDRQPAEVALVGNFPGPGTPEQPSLLERSDVITFLHEFGHVMHHLLASESPWVMFDGISTEWDFVETPSQLLEEWGKDPGVLARFAKHYQTGEIIPAGLVAKIRQADDFGRGIFVTRQMAYARISLVYHNQDPTNINLQDVMAKTIRDYSPFPYEPATYLYANFGHLNGYSSSYYTYMWSLSLAKDIFTSFEARGLMDKETARDYREKILEQGGSQDAADMVEKFLGRDYSFEAFQRWLEK